LQFLKGLQQEHLNPLTELVRTQLKEIPSFWLQLGHLTAFPTREHPRIISLTVEPHTVLMTLSNAIGQAMSVLGYPVESRLFQGHMTLARLHHDKVQADLLSLIHFPIIPPIPIHEIYLIESRPDKEGSHYIPLAQFDLNHNQLNP
jgi:2'-5' RNA ligase